MVMQVAHWHCFITRKVFQGGDTGAFYSCVKALLLRCCFFFTINNNNNNETYLLIMVFVVV